MDTRQPVASKRLAEISPEILSIILFPEKKLESFVVVAPVVVVSSENPSISYDFPCTNKLLLREGPHYGKQGSMIAYLKGTRNFGGIKTPLETISSLEIPKILSWKGEGKKTCSQLNAQLTELSI